MGPRGTDGLKGPKGISGDIGAIFIGQPGQKGTFYCVHKKLINN